MVTAGDVLFFVRNTLYVLIICPSVISYVAMTFEGAAMLCFG